MRKCFFIALCAAFAVSGDASAAAKIDAQGIIQSAVSNIVKRLSEAATKTNHVRALATPENYRLLKSTKLVDAAKKLALQKQLAEAVLEDENNDESARFKWHGRYSSQRIDMEKLTATFVHADGYEVTVKFQKPVVRDEVVAANKKLPQAPMTNGVPAKLAAARLRRYQEKVEPVVTVNQEIDANRAERPGL